MRDIRHLRSAMLNRTHLLVVSSFFSGRVSDNVSEIGLCRAAEQAGYGALLSSLKLSHYTGIE